MSPNTPEMELLSDLGQSHLKRPKTQCNSPSAVDVYAVTRYIWHVQVGFFLGTRFFHEYKIVQIICGQMR